MLEYKLAYPGKRPLRSIVDSVHPIPLKPIARFGQGKLLRRGWVNMLIWGDNLPVLRTLLEDADIKGKVRLVYIDPPYATEQTYRSGEARTATISASHSDTVAYQDTLTGGDYLEFLRARLFLLRELMADDGSIYVHIGDEMVHLVRILMDEVFGAERFINQITRIKCNPKNFERRAYGSIKDNILFYSKTDTYVWNGSWVDYTPEDIVRLFPKVDKEGRRYTTTPLHAPGETQNGPTGQPWRGILPPKGRHWRYPPDVLEELDRQGLIEWSSTGNPRKKIYADDFLKKRKKRQDVWEFKDPPYPSYPTEKNLEMLKAIVQVSSNEEDIVLDCFAGSGTTLVAAEHLGRRWIGIDNSPKAIEVALSRLLSIPHVSPFTLHMAEGMNLHVLQEILKKQGAYGISALG